MDVATDRKLNQSTAAIASVLCATDFSPAANQAAQIAASFAKAFGSISGRGAARGGHHRRLLRDDRSTSGRPARHYRGQ